MADEKPKKLPPKARVSSPGRVTPKGGEASAPAPEAPAEKAPRAPKAPKARRDEPATTSPDDTDADAKASGDGEDTTSGKSEVGDKAKAKAGTAASGAPKAGRRPPKTKITRTDAAPGASGRYTPPTSHADEMPSPLWVPILMFTMFGLGMLVIFLNYVELLPGATTNWYLLVGLGLILGGIITATQYR